MSSRKLATSAPNRIELTTEKVVKGGRMLARSDDGKVVFVSGALPGERVLAEFTLDKKSYAEASVVEVLESSSDRVVPPCPHVTEGCGGCDWQHISPSRQSELRRDIVADALTRIAKIENPIVESGPDLSVSGYRTSVRMLVKDGKVGFRAKRSDDLVAAPGCTISHPEIRRIASEYDSAGHDELTFRLGARTNEHLVVPTSSDTNDSEAFYHEILNGRRFKISAKSFFQCRPDGAEALLATAAEYLGEFGETLLDAYCGVGIFGAVIGGERQVTGVEWSESSTADCKENYPAGARVVRERVERYQPAKFDTVIADPARRGLEPAGVKVMLATGASRIVLVSCDPASFARDAKLLIDEGFTLDRCRSIDIFGQTSHVEVVSLFLR